MKIFSIILIIVGVTLFGILGAFQLFGDEIISEVKKNTESVSIESSTSSDSTVQIRQYTIKVSNTGGERQMNYCAGGFTKMNKYEGLNNKTLLSAHNNCGGDIILPIALGDHVIIENQGTYEVTDLRDTPKNIHTSDIVNMNGEILLQSCYYEYNKMKFVALTPIS